MQNIKTTFLFILSIFRPYKLYIIGLLAIELVWAINSSARPYLVKIIVDSLDYNNFNASSPIAKSFLLFTVLSIIQVFLFRISDYLYAKMMPFVIKDTILRCFKRVNRLPYLYFKDTFGGSIASNIYETADSLEYIFNTLIYRLIARILVFVIACLTISLIIDKSLAILLFSAFFILSIFNFYLARAPYKLAKLHMESYVILIGNLVDSIVNMLSVILLSGRKYEYKHINEKASAEAINRQKVQFSMLYIELGNSLFLVLINLLCFMYSIYLYKEQLITIGDITFILLMMINLSDILRNIERDILRFLENFGKCAQTLQLMETVQIATDKKSATSINIKLGNIEFRKVSFGYTKDKIIFNELSLKIYSNQKIVCLGHSGSGKTTFVDLILRLFPINSGAILIDNQNINTVIQNSLYSSISLIPQDPILFNRSIFENIIYGSPNASKKEVITASKMALAHDFIINLPCGYNTIVGERGEKLSGGQRKLIAIARIMLKNNKILIVDELTSNLDIISRHRLKSSMKKFIQNKTVISISHSIEDALDADRILLFEKGCVVADGNHKELLKTNKFYKNFYCDTYQDKSIT
ncbi:MAG: ABC transporter ATP-binding protein/permease [Rickettsiaceae bacterium]|nr:ABC transporter ATP-binding protein/permease [Rickettsiaceae bacterium]MDP5083221.1 ABC transporter ATP-binding protein/permease [Rickettsiaceae bacterium]